MNDTQRMKLWDYYKRKVPRSRLQGLTPVKPDEKLFDTPEKFTYENWKWYYENA